MILTAQLPAACLRPGQYAASHLTRLRSRPRPGAVRTVDRRPVAHHQATIAGPTVEGDEGRVVARMGSRASLDGFTLHTATRGGGALDTAEREALER